MGGKHFTIPCSIAKNGFSIELSSLIDTGANGFAFVHREKAAALSRVLSVKPQRLPHSIPVQGYDGQSTAPVTEYLTLNLILDGRKILNAPFLILDLGSTDIIIGRSCLGTLGIKPDCATNRLEWPPEYPPTDPVLLNDKLLPPSVLLPKRIDESAQADVYARDKLMAVEEKRRKDGRHSHIGLAKITLKVKEISKNKKIKEAAEKETVKEQPHKTLKDLLRLTSEVPKEGQPALASPSRPGRFIPDYRPRLETRHTQVADDRRSLGCMEKELQNLAQEPAPSKPRRPKPLWEPAAKLAADLGIISGSAFHFNCLRPTNEFCTTSLYEISRILEEKYELAPEYLREPGSSKSNQGSAAQLCHIQDSEVPLADSAFDQSELERKVPLKYHQYLDVFSKAASDELSPHRSYDHRIELEKGKSRSDLSFSPLYKMSVQELEVVKKYLEDNLSKGFIEPSQSPFAAPILFVKKADGGLRFCIDFRKLNFLSRKDRYPLPLIDETLSRLATAKRFTKLDIRQAFHKIRMDPESEDLTTFRTRYGAYKCKVLPFGLTNGPATFQRYMNDILFDYLDDFCTAYLDDILIYSENVEEHDMHVRKILTRLRDAGLQADIKKCEFDVTETKYLGFIVSTTGLKVDPEKTAVIHKWKYPTSVKGIQSFLGFCNFYRRFIRDYGKIAAPLNHLTRKGVPWNFDASCQLAFETLRDALVDAPVLQHYNPDLPCMLETDASDGVIAAILSQKHKDDWLPVAFFSKSLNSAEQNYTIHDKEMLAIVQSFHEWRAELSSVDQATPIYTDHKALEYFMTTKQLNARQARWAEFMSEFHFMITFRSGKENTKPDALTRREDEVQAQNIAKKEQRIQTLLHESQVDPLLWEQAIQRQEPTSIESIIASISPIEVAQSIVDQVIAANRNSPSLQALRTQAQMATPRERSGFELKERLLLYNNRLVVPDQRSLRAHLIREVHDQVSTAHPGRDKTIALLRPLYYWPRMLTDIATYCSNCHACRRAAIPRDKKPGFLTSLSVPEYPWQHITMDYCSFNVDKHGYDNVLVFIDRLSKQAISVPCHKTVTATQMARLYIYHVYRYFGPPETMLSDRGPQFISAFWDEFNKILGTKIVLSLAYHPKTDGQTEIYN